jgi:hypothetical protein
MIADASHFNLASLVTYHGHAATPHYPQVRHSKPETPTYSVTQQTLICTFSMGVK